MHRPQPSWWAEHRGSLIIAGVVAAALAFGAWGWWQVFAPAELQKMKEKNTPLAPGDYFYFTITNNTANDLFPSLFNISTDGANLYRPASPGPLSACG